MAYGLCEGGKVDDNQSSEYGVQSTEEPTKGTGRIDYGVRRSCEDRAKVQIRAALLWKSGKVGAEEEDRVLNRVRSTEYGVRRTERWPCKSAKRPVACGKVERWKYEKGAKRGTGDR